MRVLIHIYFSLNVYNLHRIHSVSLKKSTRGFLNFFHKGWEFLVQFLLAYYFSYLYTRLQIFVRLSPTVMKSWHIKCDHPACVSADGGHVEHMM